MPQTPDTDPQKRPLPPDDLGTVIEKRDGNDTIPTKKR